MNKTFAQAAAAAILLCAGAGSASAGAIDSACMRSDRSAANRQLCGCIQQVADFTLRGGDQRKVASFFKDPDRAQDVKMSKTNADDAFWDRYEAFTAQAEAYCTAG